MSRRTVAIANAIKIAEYLGELIDTGKWDGRDSYARCLADYGIEWLGGGCYSRVYRADACPGVVIKLTLKDTEVSITYLAWARAHPGPHVPTIHHLARHKKCQVAVMDQLFPMDGGNESFFIEHMGDYHYDDPYDPSMGGVVEVAYQIHQFFKGITGWDLHSGNVMQDEDGNMVITDPITESKDKDTRVLCSGIEKAYGVTAKAA